MKFYKIHAAKFKELKVLFIPEQFTEIGPDAFLQTQFEIIVLSRKVKVIRNHAFSGLKKCKVYIPKTVAEIEPLAFDDLDIGNEFFCVIGSEAYKICCENDIKINENVESFLEEAEKLWLEQEKIENESKSINATATENKIEKPEEVIDTKENVVSNVSVPMAEECIKEIEETSPTEEVQNVVLSLDEEKKKDEQARADLELFIEKFGFPPVVETCSVSGVNWKRRISGMSTEIIMEHYDDNDFCDEYKYYCYMELKNRFINNEFDIDFVDEVQAESDESIMEEMEQLFEDSDDISDEDGILSLLGAPPGCFEISTLNQEWKQQIKTLPTAELLKRYDSEDWCEEYRYLCYIELSTRSDLADVLFK